LRQESSVQQPVSFPCIAPDGDHTTGAATHSWAFGVYNVSVALWLDESVKVWAEGVVIRSHTGVGMGIKLVGLSRETFNATDMCLKRISKEENPSPVRLWLPATHRQ
jgi:hypothetical protein